MRRNLIIFLVILIAAATPAMGLAWVSENRTCQQQDIAGTWDVEVWGEAVEGIQCWHQCSLTIDPDGNVQGTFMDCGGAASFNVSSGQLLIDAGCVIQGEIQLDDDTLIPLGPGGITEDGKITIGTEVPLASEP